MEPSRNQSFSDRLVGAPASFFLSVICFLVAMLALSVQHSVRYTQLLFEQPKSFSCSLTNQIEKLHWQLALAQVLRPLSTPDRDSSEVLVELEKIVSVQDTEKHLKNLLLKLESVINFQIPIQEDRSCPEEQFSQEQAEESWVRPSVGIALFVILAVCSYVWNNLDDLMERAPKWIIQLTAKKDNPKPLSKIVAYRMDRWFSVNSYSKVLALLYFTVFLVVVGSLAMYSVTNASLYEAVWNAIAGVGIDWTFSQDFHTDKGITLMVSRVVSVLISLGGLLVTALLLGIISEIISDKVDEMKKGRSEVLEVDHTLILGWSDEMVPIVRQICLANESIGGAPIVILAERDKEEMEAEIMKNDIEFHGSKIICRSGNPLLRHDLDKVSVHLARSIIVLANQQSPDQSDARVLRIILSLVAFHETGGLQGYIVAEVCDVDNEPLVKLVGGALVQTVVSHDIIGRLMLQCALQPGLAAVYEEIMGFAGCEFYFQKWPELTGQEFGKVMLSFPDAVPIGVKKAIGQKIEINVSDDYVFQEDDELLVIAEDENTYKPCSPATIKPGECPQAPQLKGKERILFLGWRRDMDDMITVLDSFVAPGTELWLFNEVPISQRREMLIEGGLNPEKDLENLALYYKDPTLEGDLISRKKLEALKPSTFSSILVLADESASGDNLADADSRNLATLLLLRDIMRTDTVDIKPVSRLSSVSSGKLRELSMDQSKTIIVSEILDARTRNLIHQLNISEFVMSNEIVSMTLAMVAESADVNQVLQELFKETGSEFYIRPAEIYINEGEELSFFELMGRCRQHNEIAIGYKKYFGRDTIINPKDKQERIIGLKEVESIVVIAS